MPNLIPCPAASTNLDALFIGPHPDDIELFCGGTVIKLTSSGYRVGVADLSLGELATQGSVEVRLEEVGRASKVLAVTERYQLGFPDGSIGEEPRGHTISEGLFTGEESSNYAQLSRLVSLLRLVRPTFVVSPFWQERHPDHIAASNLVTRACFLAGLPKFITHQPLIEPLAANCLPLLVRTARPVQQTPTGRNVSAGLSQQPHRIKQIWYYPLRVRTNSSFIVDISPFMDQKQQAIACYSSQVTALNEGTTTLLSSSLNLPSLQAEARCCGAQVGVEFGESFVTKTAVPIEDPILHFNKSTIELATLFPETL